MTRPSGTATSAASEKPNMILAATQHDVHQEFGIVDRPREAGVDRKRRGYVGEPHEEYDAIFRQQVPDDQKCDHGDRADQGRSQALLVEAEPACGQNAAREGTAERQDGGCRLFGSGRRFGRDRGSFAFALPCKRSTAHVLPPLTADFTASSNPSTLPLCFAAKSSASFFSRNGAMSSPATA